MSQAEGRLHAAETSLEALKEALIEVEREDGDELEKATAENEVEVKVRR